MCCSGIYCGVFGLGFCLAKAVGANKRWNRVWGLVGCCGACCRAWWEVTGCGVWCCGVCLTGAALVWGQVTMTSTSVLHGYGYTRGFCMCLGTGMGTGSHI